MRARFVGCVVVCLLISQIAVAQSCLRPLPPFVPERADDIRAYSDLLRQDMDAYFADVQRYFRCIDAERGEVFAEAGQMAEKYGQVLAADSGSSK